MKFSDALTLTVGLATAASASPVRRTDQVAITFIGAADAQFSQSFPTDGSRVSITNPLSISHISSGTNGVSCTFHGIDNSDTTVNGAQTVDVGPPQTQVYGSCHLNGESPQVSVSFIGAADAQFSQSFPVDGSSVQITNPLSISHIEINSAGASCVFKGIDNSVTTVTGPATVDVGPPQTQVQGTCSAV
ncbi:uncharacterized protein N7473_000959 [Penicillium subrubescens]|uniref:Uncharacterized protein n=1 Tax=Penicillium subrubescens TaxID=1316194 RepID=A0A1Q5UMS0_9EURO|nr:uncharacterized protein N7473_000959 [Penicillium subrubescens]KAJ5911656.1 hypothetical protein N7473_000959 [Penicillium subrubescens]OKP13744.1 hypothetical protein PENSUB_543 [Penicillium subrubescens]